MSPPPSNFSAPAVSKMVRESIWLATCKATRLGTLALIKPVMTSTDGRWVESRRWMPVARDFWARRQSAISTSSGAVIIKSAETFLHLILHPRPYDFALTYVQSAIDFEGDMFAIMPVAAEVEELRVPLRLRLRLLLSLWKA